jgi:hypothetical protein
MTTLEVSNLGRYGFLGGRGGASLAGQMGHRHRSSGGAGAEGEVETEDGSASASPGVGHRHSHGHQHGSCAGCGSGFLMNLLGFDRFTKGKAVDGLARAGKAANPFDLGVVGNCKDFWTKGRELGVEYERLWDVPLEGFAAAKRRREREDEEEGGRYGAGGKGMAGRGKKFLMGLGIGGSSRAGYEPVSQV